VRPTESILLDAMFTPVLQILVPVQQVDFGWRIYGKDRRAAHPALSVHVVHTNCIWLAIWYQQ
jgi:hypothetical protein